MLAIAAIAAGAALPICAAHSQTLTTLHSFGGGTDGSNPYPGLIKGSGMFFGTTTFGGNTACPVGCGIVYSMTPAGSEFVLHSFSGGSDGEYPSGSLINAHGGIYGTTASGGDLKCDKGRGCGTVFLVTPGGFSKVVYAFKGNGDGKDPEAGLTRLSGTLYGTTLQGGTYDKGTVFSVTPAGTEKVIYSFKGGSDGAYPEANLIALGDTLFGTTTNGGGGKCPHGCGTVFTVTPAGIETVLHAFTGKDGAYPGVPLIYEGGILYGTTGFGGGGGCASGAPASYCDGVVFSLTLAGTESVLHAFAGGADGANPYGLTFANGTFYGTTSNGGGAGCYQSGCGTVFKVATSGSSAQYSLLYSFLGGDEAANPYGLVHMGSQLYGTSLYGGTFGGGTVFQFTP